MTTPEKKTRYLIFATFQNGTEEIVDANPAANKADCAQRLQETLELNEAYFMGAADKAHNVNRAFYALMNEIGERKE